MGYINNINSGEKLFIIDDNSGFTPRVNYRRLQTMVDNKNKNKVNNIMVQLIKFKFKE
jgi:hypothetical protein